MFAGLSWELRKALVMVGTVYLIAVIALVLLLCISTFLIYRALRQFFRFWSPREVCCPETNKFAVVQVDGLHAAVTGVFDSPVLRVIACSRWPEGQNCDRACLRRIEAGLKISAA